MLGRDATDNARQIAQFSQNDAQVGMRNISIIINYTFDIAPKCQNLAIQYSYNRTRTLWSKPA